MMNNDIIYIYLIIENFIDIDSWIVLHSIEYLSITTKA
jgi:hypothetical protein